MKALNFLTTWKYLEIPTAMILGIKTDQYISGLIIQITNRKWFKDDIVTLMSWEDYLCNENAHYIDLILKYMIKFLSFRKHQLAWLFKIPIQLVAFSHIF